MAMCKRAMSRRGFCAATGAGLITLGLAECSSGPARVLVGGLDDAPPSGGGGNPDLGGGASDLAGGASDLAQGSSSPSSVSCGPASAIAVGGAQRFTDGSTYAFYLCRDSGGLFTVDSQCTHAGCTVHLTSGEWYCPCHGATFSFDGQNPTSPAPTPLNNYAVHVDASGNVTVDPNQIVSPSTRA